MQFVLRYLGFYPEIFSFLLLSQIVSFSDPLASSENRKIPINTLKVSVRDLHAEP